ncbi:MAG TPA: hypothetical protein VKZ49_09660 [Polyangiaceae bacterium]|nr:hypothetical protein [Polyangiaceae bacterium]
MNRRAQRAVGCAAAFALLGCGADEGDESGGPQLPAVIEDPCPVPQTQVFEQVPAGTALSFTHPNGAAMEIGVGSAGQTEPTAWAGGPSTDLVLPQEVGVRVRVFARTDPDCGDWFSHVYELTDAFDPAAGTEGSRAVALDDPRIVGWASGWVNPVVYGDNVDETWRVPERGLGPAEGGPSEIVGLGDGGALTLTFDPPISDGPGDDLAVFENGVTDTFLELAFVEVSSDGQTFERFDSMTLQLDAVGDYGEVNPRALSGLAGKYRQGFGTPFDLALLAHRPAVRTRRLDLSRITHVRIVDVVGDGSALDSFGRPIYDPHPTMGSGGFDLDAVAVLRASD